MSEVARRHDDVAFGKEVVLEDHVFFEFACDKDIDVEAEGLVERGGQVGQAEQDGHVEFAAGKAGGVDFGLDIGEQGRVGG